MAIVLGGMGIVVFLIRDEEAKAARISAFLEFVIFLKESVSNYSMPISDILKTCDRGLLERCGYDVQLDITPQRLCSECRLPDDDSEHSFKSLMKDFGSSYRQSEVEKCERCIESLRKREEDMRSQLPKRKKLITCVGISAVALVLILLL